VVTGETGKADKTRRQLLDRRAEVMAALQDINGADGKSVKYGASPSTCDFHTFGLDGAPYTQERRLQGVTTLLDSLHRGTLSEQAHGTLEGTTYGSLGLNSIFCSDSSTRASVAECKLRGNLREMRLQVRASCRGQAEEGIGGWKDSRDFRVRPACWIFRDTDLVRPASHTQLNRPVTKSRSSRATLIGSMAEAWDVAGDVWDGGGGTQAGPVRWMDGGPSQAMPAASTLLHCEEPQYLTAARTSKHMDLVGTVGAVTEGAVTWMTSGSISQRGAEAASDKLRTAVSHERKL
jgi:hypothetical protein